MIKHVNSFITVVISGALIGMLIFISNTILLAQTTITQKTNITSFDGPFILFTQVWGDDYPITQTSVYDSYSNKSVGVLGNDVSINILSPRQIAKIKVDIQYSWMQSIASDGGTCDITQICYMLHTMLPMGFTGQVDTYTITDSDSNQST